ncbi:MAG: hypothetical protein KGH64_01805 [Candidatus Micrarchaeota archaeon]|nr:hypothetical protein [Candidatus Micrarchaeota archaeon]MDE1834051.1 hypothetical protein [Candidatus Micrarchaeota archaeon]MDE1859182.1 hypothetical protein [Candidatus Micrarchaeota archaeon]
MGETKLDFDYFANSDDRPLVWASENGDFLASAGLEPYWSDKYQQHLYKSKEKHTIDNLLSYTYENGAKTTARVVTPKGLKEIAFPFVKFTEIYTEPNKAIDIFKRAIENYAENQGYRIMVSPIYNNEQTAFGKALAVKEQIEAQKGKAKEEKAAKIERQLEREEEEMRNRPHTFKRSDSGRYPERVELKEWPKKGKAVKKEITGFYKRKGYTAKHSKNIAGAVAGEEHAARKKRQRKLIKV